MSSTVTSSGRFTVLWLTIPLADEGVRVRHRDVEHLALAGVGHGRHGAEVEAVVEHLLQPFGEDDPVDAGHPLHRLPAHVLRPAISEEAELGPQQHAGSLRRP